MSGQNTSPREVEGRSSNDRSAAALARVNATTCRDTRQAARAHSDSDSEGNPSPVEIEQSLARLTNDVVGAVTRDMEKLQLNTCITALIKFLYALEDLENEPCEDGTITADHSAFREAWCTVLVLLSPVTPHLCEELWERMSRAGRLSGASWPVYDPRLANAATVHIIVKVDARPVVRLEVPGGASRDEVVALAYREGAVMDRIGDRRVAREIYVPGQILNFVTS